MKIRFFAIIAILAMCSLNSFANVVLNNGQIVNVLIDDNVSSKELVNKCGQLTNYKLTEVDWTMDNPNEINTSNNTINLLERLRKLRTIENDDETAEDPYEPI